MATTLVATRRRLRTALRRGAQAAVIGGITLMLCVVGGALTLNTPLARRLLGNAVNRALAGYFCGQVTVERIGSIGLSGIRGIRVTVVNPEKHQALSLRNLDARFALLPTMRDLVMGRRKLSLTIEELSVNQVTTVLQSDAADNLNLQRAFRICAPPTPTGRSIGLSIGKINIASLPACVDLFGIPPFEAQLNNMVASVAMLPGKLTIDVTRFSIATRGIIHGADVSGAGSIKLVLPLDNLSRLMAGVHWAGSVYGTGLSAEIQWLAGSLRVGLDAPRVPTQTARRFWSEFPDGPEASIRAELQGTPPDFAVRTRIARGSGAADITGEVHFGDQKRAELHLTAEAIDLHQLFVNAPQTSLSASADLLAQQAPSGQLSGELHLTLPPNSIVGVAMPPTSIRASFLRIPGAMSNVEAKIIATETGATAQLKCRLTSNGKNTELKFEGAIRAPRLDRVPRLGRFARGSAMANVQGSLDLSTGTLNAKLALDASELKRSGLGIGRARGQATLRGPIKSPRIDLDVDANILEIAGARFSEGHVKAHGPLATTQIIADLKTVDGADVGLRGVLSANHALTVHDLQAWFNRGGGAVVRAHANTVRAQLGGIVIDDALIEGLGEPVNVSLAIAPRDIRFRATAKGVDVARIARITQAGDFGGQLDFDVNLMLQPGHADGHAALSLTRAQVGKVRDLSVQAETNLRDRDFFAHLHADCGSGNWLDLQTNDVRPDGPVDELTAWRRWSGRVGINAEINVAQLAQQLPSHLLGLDGLRGAVALRGDVAHDMKESSRPNVHLMLQGTQLGFSLHPAGSRPRAKTAGSTEVSQFQGIAANVSLAYKGESDQTHVETQLSDATGVIATLDVTADALPYAALLSAPRTGLGQLKATPLTAQLDLPRRGLNSLPGGLLPQRTRGDVQAKLNWTGTLMHPEVALETQLTQVRVPGSGMSRPVDLVLVGHYDGEAADGKLRALLNDHEVFEADAQLQTRAADWFTERAGNPIPWVGSARARLIKFPLESIRALGDSEVSGELNGELAIDGLNHDATGNLKLETEKLHVRDLVLTAGAAQVVIHPNNFDARIRLEDNSAFAEARLSGASTWGNSLMPSIDDSRTVRAALSADRFRIATLLPFTGGLLSDLDGRVDAAISAEIDSRKRAAGLSGVASLQGGRFELAAGGGEFRDIDAQLVLKPDGTVQLETLTAHGVSGRLQVTANARFDGFGWASSEAHLRIPANSAIPLTLEGAGYGSAFGQIDVLAVRAPNHRDILMDFDVPSFNVTLPTTAAHTVKRLEPMPGVRFGSRQSGGKFVPLNTRLRASRATPGGTQVPARVTIKLNLGKEVKVTRENSLEVSLTGSPQITLTNSVSVSGQIQLVRGFLDVEGKRFDIDQGTVTFVGDDPTNPQADVTASWTAADGTVVYAEFSGPLRTGKVTLRSDPQLAKNEILALLLFGGTDGLATQSSNQAQASGSNMIGLAQGAATQPINHALQDYGLSSVSTRVDTSAANPRPEVEVRIARDIALQIAWVLGTPPPGSNPDRTLFTIDWQFFRRWSLETTVGDAGTSIADVVWHYGY